MSLGLIRTVFLRTWRGERSLALLCTASITARGRGSKFARPMEKMKRRGRRIIVAAAQRTTHPLLKVARGMTQIRDGERGGEREAFTSHVRVRWRRGNVAGAVIWGADGGEDVNDAQVL